jgi:hypothetical protein
MNGLLSCIRLQWLEIVELFVDINERTGSLLGVLCGC